MIYWPVTFVLIMAMAAGWWFRKLLPGAPVTVGNHNVALDGFRGYLAFGVFLHHAVIWYFYLQTSEWALTPSGAPGHDAGQSFVKYFFMTTSFLFVGKILDHKQSKIDWLSFYISRLLRIVPAYLLAIGMLFLMVGTATHWQLLETPAELLRHLGAWLLFNFANMPVINTYEQTERLIASVIWSLKYEWLFYIALPLIAVFFRTRMVWPAVAISSALLIFVWLKLRPLYFPMSFALGAGVAILSRQDKVATLLRTRFAAIIVIPVALAQIYWETPNLLGLFMITSVFSVVACGNTLFGILTHRAAVFMGEASYGIYLFHGLVLSMAIFFVVGPVTVRQLSPLLFWVLVGMVGCITVMLSLLSYHLVELPMLRRARPWSTAMHGMFGFFQLAGKTRQRTS